MERVLVTIEVKYNEDGGPVPDTEELQKKFNEICGREYVLDPSGEEQVYGYSVEAINPRREAAKNGEFDEFLSNINQYIFGE